MCVGGRSERFRTKANDDGGGLEAHVNANSREGMVRQRHRRAVVPNSPVIRTIVANLIRVLSSEGGRDYYPHFH